MNLYAALALPSYTSASTYMPWTFEFDHFHAIFIQIDLFLGLLHFFPVLVALCNSAKGSGNHFVGVFVHVVIILLVERPSSAASAPWEGNKTNDKEAALGPIPACWRPRQHHRSDCQSWQK